LKQLKVRVIVIDEGHNLLAGSPREQRVILQLFRHLSNELKASLVFLGIADAREAIAGDTQLSRRLDQMALPRWKADDEFQSLVIAILRSLPLRRPSALSAHSLRTLARATDGITAKVFGMLSSPWIRFDLERSKSPTRMSRAGRPPLNEKPPSPDVRFSVSIGTRIGSSPN
jgi:Bacterial TniB protein